MSLESILMVVAPICLFTVGVIVLPILVKPRKQSGQTKRYIRGLQFEEFLIKNKDRRLKKRTKWINKVISLFEDINFK